MTTLVTFFVTLKLEKALQASVTPFSAEREGQEQKNNTDVPKMEKEIAGTPDKDFIREHIYVVRPPITESKGFKIG